MLLALKILEIIVIQFEAEIISKIEINCSFRLLVKMNESVYISLLSLVLRKYQMLAIVSLFRKQTFRELKWIR